MLNNEKSKVVEHGDVQNLLKFFLTSIKKKENGILAKEDLEKTQQYSCLFSPDYSKMHSKKAIEKLEKLKYFRYPDDAKLKLKEKFPFNEMDEEEFNMCIEEFKKYIGLVLVRQYERTCYYKNKYSRVAMASDIIDEVWHNLILFSTYTTSFQLPYLVPTCIIHRLHQTHL